MRNYKRKSKHVSSGLLGGEEGFGNYYKYDVKASQVTDQEIKAMAKLANDRLYKLEKSGQSEYSREYQLVEHYAVGDPNGKGSIYNVSDDYSRIRFTSSTKGMDQEERSYYVNTLRNFLRSETSKVSGTREAVHKAYESFAAGKVGGKLDITEAQYKDLWKTYRESALPDKLSHEGYNAFIEMVQTTNLYTLTSDQMAQALQYIHESSDHSIAGKIGGAVTDLDFLSTL